MQFQRVPFMLLALIALVAGIFGGLWRVGLAMPSFGADFVIMHGPLMVCGFLGTVIGLERAAAGKQGWMYMAPVLSGLSTFFLIMPLPKMPGLILITLGSAVLVGVFAFYVRQHPSLHMKLMAGAAVMWFVGNVLWLIGFGISEFVIWWAGFIILTIAGERLDLAKFLKITPNIHRAFMTAIGFLTVGVAVSITRKTGISLPLASLGMVLLASWLLRFDIARLSMRKDGLMRFIGVALFTGYIWLAVAGLIGVVGDIGGGGFLYDAFLHAIFVGFAFSMIFGHAPVIFPGVLGIRIPYQWFFYVHLALLHVSLLIRLIGDVLELPTIRLAGAILNAVAIGLFFFSTLIAAIFFSEKS